MKASQTQVFLFDGERKAVQDRVNDFLRALGRNGSLEPEIMGIGYNYQGPEYDGRAPVEGSASHGLLLIAYYPTISEAREMRGLDPISVQPGPAPAGEPTVVPLEDFLRSFAAQAPAAPKRSLWQRAKKLFGKGGAAR